MTGAESTPTFGARLSRTAGKLVLALLNATLLLFIVAAIVGIVLIGKVRTLATDVAGDVTRSAIASTGLDPAATLAELRLVSGEIVDLRTAIEERRGDLDVRTAALDDRLKTVQATIRSLRDRKIELTDAVIDRAARAASTATTNTADAVLKRLRDCPAPDPGSNAGS
jgi:hypothetical protein